MKTTFSLVPNEQFCLHRCEEVIARGLETFAEVGHALTEIRDSKLYRDTHKTFEAYCKERWEVSRPRAYQLIDHAKVVKEISEAANLSCKIDISSRDMMAAKSDLPAVTAEIKSRIEAGEEPKKAISDVVAAARSDRQFRGRKPDPEVEALHAHARNALPQDVKDQIAARDAAVSARKKSVLTDENLTDLVEELEAINESFAAENASLKEKVSALEPMRLEYERGGFAEVIKGLAEQVRVLKTRVETESQEKVKNLRAMDYWKSQAIKLGFSRDAFIDIETGQEVSVNG